MEKLEWSALEYEEKERSPDWFWALGIVVVSSSIAAIIFGNYFFAVLLFLSGTLLGFFAIKSPDLVPYELNMRGLQIRTHLYPYENIKAFWVERSGEHKDAPVLLIKSERFFMPIISIPLDSNIAHSVRSIMLSKEVAEEKMIEHPSAKILESLGF